MISNKEILRASGYPRSGNTYLNYALRHLYYATEPTNITWHTVAKLDAREKIIVPIRKPLDCISSLHLYPSNCSLDMDIKYYIRFHEAVLSRLDKIVLMDFDYFTENIEYIKDKVSKNFGIGTDSSITDTQVKEVMLAGNKDINLPRNNQEELNAVKERLVNQPLFEKCINLYRQIKENNEQSKN